MADFARVSLTNAAAPPVPDGDVSWGPSQPVSRRTDDQGDG